jgi:hypothetical protein
MTPNRMFAVLISGLTLLWSGLLSSPPASAQVVERGVEGGAVGAIIGGIVGGGKGAATGAAIGAGVGVLSGAAEANSRAQGYYGPPPSRYGPPPPGYYGAPPAGYYGASPGPGVVDASISMAPPPLPAYDQPLCPGPGYVWTPGYWAYSAGGYYWVPGTWVLPPAVGLLWTPGYWGYEGTRYVWHDGYWGPHVGYYGGVDYGSGYYGSGYEGGYWDNGVFFYNTAATRVDPTAITNTYNRRIEHNLPVNNVSFNGPGGTTAQPTAQELTWAHERHTPPTTVQVKHRQAAGANRALFASVNHGTPLVAATAEPGVFKTPTATGPKAPKGVDKSLATGAPRRVSPGPEQPHGHKPQGWPSGDQANIQGAPSAPGATGSPGKHGVRPTGPGGPNGPGLPGWPSGSQANIQGGNGGPSDSGGPKHKGRVGPGNPGQTGWPSGGQAKMQGGTGVPYGPGDPRGGKGKGKPAVCNQHPDLPVCEQKH